MFGAHYLINLYIYIERERERERERGNSYLIQQVSVKQMNALRK